MEGKVNRVVSVLLAAVMVWTAFLTVNTSVYAESENEYVSQQEASADTAHAESMIYGDVNGDGYIKINDATFVQKHCADIELIEEDYLPVSDVNGDNSVNVKDATIIQRYITGVYFDSLVGKTYVPSSTETVTTVPYETEPSQTLPSETEPAETQQTITTTVMTDPAKTEPSEVLPTETEPAETQPPTTVPATQAASTLVTAATVPAPVVGTVKNVTKTSFETNKITLKWDKVSGASGYFVYIKNADSSSSYKKLADVTSNTYTASNLIHTTQYHFKISAYILKNGVKYEGSGTVKKTATQPGKVSNLRMVRSSSVIEFAWDRNSKATGYRIYRACSATNAEYVLYKTIRGNSTTSFSDTNIEMGRAYYYSVRPFRELYNTEYNAPHSTIKFICGMSAPNYSMTSQLSRVSLTWNKNKYATGYDIYYSTSKSGTFKLLGTTKNNYFNTVRLTDKKTYYFRVQPYKLNGASQTKVLGTYATRSKTVTKNAYGVSVGGTYIEISLKQQHMWFYINGELYCHTDVVTGNADGTHDTPKGAFKIWQRLSPTVLVGPGYASPVDYWLAFTSSGVGIHDASWRSSGEYGGTTYKGNGSHGCVNTPYSAVKKIYQKATIGTRVVVY